LRRNVRPFFGQRFQTIRSDQRDPIAYAGRPRPQGAAGALAARAAPLLRHCATAVRH
jgi:hypothetical protein